jgi:glycosyltransferase involved in cell wall biosynthesis
VLFTMVELGPGGVETNVLNLLRRLDPARFELSLFLHHDPAAGRHAAPRALPPHVRVAWALRGPYRRWKLPYALKHLLTAARQTDVIVAAQEGRATLLACLAGMLLRKPVVGCIQFDWASAGLRMRRRQRWGLRWLCPSMRRIVACGEDSAASLSRIARIAPGRLKVIPNFVEASRVRSCGTDASPPWADGVFAKPTVVAMGRLDEQKGFDVLIRAHAMLVRRHVDHHLLILGEGHLRGSLTELARSLGVERSVFMPGFVAQPFAVLRRGTLFALPSRFEGLPFALIEAMTLGLPVVASDCPSGPGEVLEGGRFGLLVPVDDPTALADALAGVLADPSRQAELSELSRRRAANYADVSAIPAWEELLEAAC